jgi:LacI family transcriptional regulator, repressor for deo operon, udp, cdd, tsx, nupC, and nupG
VSESTVSRVLNGDDTVIAISEQTRQSVLEAARELDYRPHPGARFLRGRGTGLIGLIVREANDPFFAELINVIAVQAQGRGYGVILGYAHNDPAKALTLTHVLDPRLCDGLLLLGDLGEPRQSDELAKRLRRQDHMVMVSRGGGALLGTLPSIGVDNHAGGRLVMNYLTELGHRRIAFVSAKRAGDFHERLLAYERHMHDCCGGAPAAYVQIDENSHEGGYQAMRRALSLPEPPTAVWCADDTMAVGAYAAAQDQGYAVPEDLSIVGFDDTRVAAYLRPALTTVRQPLEEIGRRAVELLLAKVAAKAQGIETTRIFVEPQLVVRDSCKPPRYATRLSV